MHRRPFTLRVMEISRVSENVDVQLFETTFEAYTGGQSGHGASRVTLTPHRTLLHLLELVQAENDESTHTSEGNLHLVKICSQVS
jgi:hypothetical protein